MRHRLLATLAAVALTASLAACSSDAKSSSSTGPGPTGSNATGSNGSGAPGASNGTTPGVPSNIPGLPSITLPTGLTIPPGGTFPAGVTIPGDYIDAMIAQLEAAGMKVDHDCFRNLMKDADVQRAIFTASTPSNEIISKLVACFKA